MGHVDVENLAVGKITGMIGRCPHLKAFIDSGDKTPFTDGHIDLYGGLGQNKTEFVGRVPVQVKGRTRSGKRKDQQSFSITRADLLGFQRNSGVLFFYVAMDRQGKQRTPYYAILSPFAIEGILRSVPTEQATIAVVFKKLRNDPSAIERILGLALKTRDQNPALGFDPALFERMQSITVHTVRDLTFDEPVVLAPGKLDYALEIVTDGGMRVPMGGELHIFPSSYAEHPIDAVIGAGGVSYSDVMRQQVGPNSMVLRLAPGLTLTMTETPAQRLWNFELAAKGSVADRVKAAQFVDGFLDDGMVEVNGTPTPLGLLAGDGETNVVEVRRQLSLIKQMSELFEYLDIDASLVDLEDVDDSQIRNIRMLHRALVVGEDVNNPDGEVSRGLFSIGRWTVMLIITEGSAPGKWRFVDPFDPNAPHLFRWSSEDDLAEAFPVTVYDVVAKEELPTLLNLRLGAIVRAYDAIVETKRTLTLANHQVLALLGAADAVKSRREEFLQAADALNEWVIEHEGALPIHRINRWQIQKRMDALSPTDMDEIRGLRRSIVNSNDPRAAQIELACALLTGDSAEADYLIAQLPDDSVAEVKSWPIWQLRDTSRAVAH
jgi:hypothetical protein